MALKHVDTDKLCLQNVIKLIQKAVKNSFML